MMEKLAEHLFQSPDVDMSDEIQKKKKSPQKSITILEPKEPALKKDRIETKQNPLNRCQSKFS